MGLADLIHRSTMILKVKVYINGPESGGKPRRGTQQLVNEFHQLAAKNLNVNAVQRSIASVIWYSIQGKKNILYSLFDRPKSGFVRPKNYLAGQHARRPTVRYFEPCTGAVRSCIGCGRIHKLIFDCFIVHTRPNPLIKMGTWSSKHRVDVARS